MYGDQNKAAPAEGSRIKQKSLDLVIDFEAIEEM